MKQNDQTAVNKLIESNTELILSLCTGYRFVSDEQLESLYASAVADNLRIIKKLKGLGG